MSGWRAFIQIGGHWKWADVSGYRLMTQEVGGIVYEVLEVRLADGVSLKAALNGQASRAAVESLLSAQGVRPLGPSA